MSEIKSALCTPLQIKVIGLKINFQ
jgi:hypothetical protein